MKRDLMTMALDLGNELIIDNFAGGGGTSTGLEAAFGRPVDIAINHDPEALAMHAINHPYTKHLCESVWDVDPIEVTGNQPIGLVWLSPDCKHFSKAKGGKPVEKKIRGLAWVTLRWAAKGKPRVIMLENVEEFQTWGPLMRKVVDGVEVWMPDPAKKGVTFRSFKRQLEGHGYKIEFRELRASDHANHPQAPVYGGAPGRPADCLAGTEPRGAGSSDGPRWQAEAVPHRGGVH
jgi:DNA (cytosine-5)-methyltransferase 1